MTKTLWSGSKSPPVHAEETATELASTQPASAFWSIPNYSLGEPIGRGGMGSVFRARDLQMNREVAVKILQERFTPQSLTAARFVEEALITGQLQHPGIPPIYQVGTFGDGRPFLVMKLIKGQTLDELLHNGAPINKLAILEAVAQAVGYAHAHGVIHRDLKPANVMVGAFGEVQVMDWGLAKLLTQESSPHAPITGPGATTPPTLIQTPRDGDANHTQAGSILGTPAYMAPEQAAGELQKIDQRSDVFGLGALLCVLLTGRPPFSGNDADCARLNAMRGRMDEALAALACCDADPDVVALCKACLSFEPSARPADANAVADQVASLRQAAEERARHAELEKARAEVQVSEQRKRRRVWLSLAASLLVGVILISAFALWANESRKDAEQAWQTAEEKRRDAVVAQGKEAAERVRAEEQTALAKGVKDFLKFDVLRLADAATQSKDEKLEYDADVTLREVIMQASKTIDVKFAKQPLVEAEVRWIVGETLWCMNWFDPALTFFERTRALYVQARGPDHPDTIKCMNSLAANYVALGRNADALPLQEATWLHQHQRLGPDHANTLRSRNNLANVYTALRRYTDACQVREESVRLLKAKLGDDHPDTLACRYSLANNYADAGRSSDAFHLYEETLALVQRKLGASHPETLESMQSLAVKYAALGRPKEALHLRETTFALMKQLYGPDHHDTLQSMQKLANGYFGLGRHLEALTLREESLTLMRGRLGADHPDTLQCEWGIITSLVTLKRSDEAKPRIDEVVQLVDQATAAGKPVDQRLLPAMFAIRMQIHRDQQDATGCRHVAESWEKRDQKDFDSLYVAGRYRAITAAVQATSADASAPLLARDDADKAMDWLTKAVAAGFRDRGQLETVADLAPLREREDFRKLLESLPQRTKK